MELKKNHYGSLCTEMYEILHEKAPQDELEFYLSYAEKEMSILEPLCGSGRFLIPFLEKGYQIKGVDNSREMLEKLKQKAPDSMVEQSDIEKYQTQESFDYIFISSGSVSLFTDMESCKSILSKMKTLLKKGGKFVFAVDTTANRCPDTDEYKESISVRTKENYELVLKTKSYFDETSHTQFGPGLYELYCGTELLQEERMDFQTHLYELGEMESILKEIGFTTVLVYSSFEKEIAEDNCPEMFLYECSF